ncbi:MAG: hypothetical protein QXU75_07445 [Candidatus Methanomethylicaceae archaeon]
MKKVYWVSRHKPLPAQVKELCRLFGQDTVIEVDPNPFSSAEEIVQRFRESNAQEMVVVAPLSVIAKLTELGIQPLWAQMNLVPAMTDPNREVVTNGRVYRFEEFQRIIRVEVVMQKI